MNLQSMKLIDRIFEVNFMDKDSKVIEKFRVLTYKGSDLFITKPQLRIKAE